MKALKKIFAVLFVSALAFGLAAQAADEKASVTLTFTVDPALSGTYKTADGNCYLKLSGGNEWELGSLAGGKEAPLYKGTCAKNDAAKEVVLAKTHYYGQGSKSWKEEKAENWKAGKLGNDATSLAIVFAESELKPRD